MVPEPLVRALADRRFERLDVPCGQGLVRAVGGVELVDDDRRLESQAVGTGPLAEGEDRHYRRAGLAGHAGEDRVGPRGMAEERHLHPLVRAHPLVDENPHPAALLELAEDFAGDVLLA